MKTAIFKNFSEESFTGYWDGRPKTFAPGYETLMPEYLARHFAKHLVNRELQRLGHDRSTSPKKPEDVPEFMKLFNKAFKPAEDVDTPNEDPVEVQIAMANAGHKQPAAPAGHIDVKVDGLDDEDEDDEANFAGKPKESDDDNDKEDPQA